MSEETVFVVTDRSRADPSLPRGLEDEGFCVVLAESKERAVELARGVQPSLIVIEGLFPRLQVFELAMFLRKSPETRHAGLIVLATENGCTMDQCASSGADECVTRPLPFHSLVERIHSVLKRRRLEATVPAGLRIEHHGLLLDTDTFQAEYEGDRIQLTLSEFQLLLAMASQPGYAFSRNELLRRIQRSRPVHERIIDVHIKAIRKKLGEGSGLIETVRGVGYRLRN